MEDDLLCLRWRDHLSTLSHMLPAIRQREVYCDATIACDGRFYPVHRLVLSTCSEYFERMFEVADKQHLMIVLADIQREDLETLLDYMYIGEVNVLQSDLSGFMKAAERLKIKGLAEPTDTITRKEGVDGKRSLPQKEDNWEVKRRRENKTKEEEKVCHVIQEEGKTYNKSQDEATSVSVSRGEGVTVPSSNMGGSQQQYSGDDNTATTYDLDISKISLQGMEEIILKDEPEDWCSVVEDTRQRDPNVLYCNNSDQVSQRCLSSDGWNFSSLVEENPSYSLAFDRTLFPKDYPGGFHKTSVTSLMPSDMIQVGDKFSSLAKLEQAITLYEAETMTKLYKRDSRKLVSKRVQRDIKAELVYYDLVYACVKGGRIYYTRGRPSRNSLKSGCTMQIRLKASRDGQFLEVVHKVEQHNHSLTETHMSYRGRPRAAQPVNSSALPP